MPTESIDLASAARGAPAPSWVVRTVNPLDDPAWDADLAACAGSGFFHTAAWARVLHGAYGYRPLSFVTRDDSGAKSVLSFMEVNSWLTGRRGVALPFTDECAPIANQASFDRLHEAALACAKKRGWKYMEVRGGRPLFGAAASYDSYFSHHLDLRGGEASLFARCDSSVRRAVRKAEQSGLSLEFSRDLEAVRAFHGLLQKTRRRHGVPPQPFHFFASIHRHVLAEKKGWVVLARKDSRPVAGAVYFCFGDTAVYKYGASDETHQNLRANNRVMWEAIKRFAAEGLTTLNFGRTEPANEGLRRFKLSWGATEHPIEYFRRDVRSGRFLSPKGRNSGWSARIFQRMPIPVSRLIGAVLYKHVA